MKNKLLILTLLLPLWMGCSYDNADDCIEEDPGSTYMSLRSSQIILPSDSEDEVESITIETLRILVFSKTTGMLVTNKLFSVEDLSLATYDSETGKWSIDFSDMVVETRPGPSIVYVVLNENIMSISGQTLTGALNMISTLTEMQTLVNTPLFYTTPIRVIYDSGGKPVEPPFIMSTFDEFDIEPNRPIDNPYMADLRGPDESLKGFALDRTMAKVTIESVSSYPIEGGPATNNEETSYIFILKMGLANVPMQYLWSPNRLQPTPPNPNPYTVPVPAYTGAYQDIDFGLEDPDLGYYDRDWNGSVRLLINANAYEVQELKDSRIWYTGRGSGSGSYTLNKYELDANLANNFNNVNDQCFLSYYSDSDGDGERDPSPIDLNAGNFLSMVQSLYVNPDPNAYLPTWYQLIEPYTIQPEMTAAYWSLKQKDISYYVPEHILEDKTNRADATSLHVKAVKAFIPNHITKEQSTHIEWNTTNWGNWEYAVTPGGGEFDVTGNAFTAMMRTIWGYELDTITVNNVPTVIVRHYWSGGLRYRYGVATGVLTGSQFLNITNSTDVMDFYLPVRNTPDNPVDYNIYRNHEYKFSVHALEQWTPGTSSANATARGSGTDTLESSMVLRMNNK